MMTEQKNPSAKIKKTIIDTINGVKVREQTLIVEGENMCEVSKEFDKRWGKDE